MSQKSIETKDVIDALTLSIGRLGAKLPLRQGQFKSVTILAADDLVGRLMTSASPKPKLWANRKSDSTKGGDLRNSVREENESMLDVAVYAGETDPLTTVLTLECEVYPSHTLESADSSTCDYLWDLFKLMQVPSPVRIFLARTTSRHRKALERHVARIVYAYQHRLVRGDRVFAIVFPTAMRDYGEVRCVGWEKAEKLSPLNPTEFRVIQA